MLILAGLAVSAASRYRMQAIEVKQTAFRLDAVPVPPAERDDAPLLFTEAQFQGRPTFYARWLAVVVFPDRSADTGIMTPPGLIQCGLLRRVYLSDLLGAEHLGFNTRLARLVMLDPADTPAEARALAAERETMDDPLDTGAIGSATECLAG